MSKIFISYSHKDKKKVQDIVSQIADAGHDVWIDESKLLISDPITSEIQKNILAADYVIVFLSPNSAESTWVRQEIYATLYQELRNKKMKLIPCLIKDCKLPKAFTKTKKFSRIYEIFPENQQDAMKNILSILNDSTRAVFTDEYYAILNIPISGLEIYLPGETYG
ncbi:MAG: toll/interleukin-1 receptor domain-containing protein, partial [Anaerolineales bacterium]|nr:toll/interleukin-1 receptor domain-containing protein [Anaerolineales bacterium]